MKSILNYFNFLCSFIYVYIYSYFGYIINYNTAKINQDIYVSLTTIPSRSNTLLYTINSILNQTVLPGKIYITICKSPLREKNIKYKIPKIVYQHSIIEVITKDKDNGPIDKLYGGLLRCKKPNDIIITIDDDSIYHNKMIQKILYWSNLFPECCIGSIGRQKYDRKLFGYNFEKHQKVIMLEGYGGVGYKKKFFNLDDINTEKLSKEIKFNDDIYISYLLKKKKIPLILINNGIKEPLTYSLFTKNTNPLWMTNEGKGYYQKCIDILNI